MTFHFIINYSNLYFNLQKIQNQYVEAKSNQKSYDSSLVDLKMWKSSNAKHFHDASQINVRTQSYKKTAI